MQYISTEGLLIDTVKNETKILGKTNTVEISSGSFLGENNVTKENSISFGGTNVQTTDGSLSYGGSNTISTTSSINVLSQNSNIYGNSVALGVKSTTINATSSIAIGGNNNNINKAVNSTQSGIGIISIGGLNNKIGSDSIVIGSSSVELDNNSVSIGGYGNRNASYSNVVFLNTRNTVALSSNTVYIPRTYVMGDFMVNGNLSASGTVTYIQPSIIATQGYLTAVNITNNKPVMYLDQQYVSNKNVAEFYHNSKPKFFVNEYGASINTTNSSSTHALTISGSLSASGGATLRDTLWFNNKTNGTVTTNLYALSSNILKTDAGFTMGGGLTSNYLSIISVNSDLEGLRVTQTGSGPAFIVEDQASVDPSPFMILGDGKVGVGTRTPNQKLTVIGTISAATSGTDVGNIYSEGSVIIGSVAGTTTIPEKLTVNGSISASQNLILREGTTSSNGIIFGNDSNLYRNGASTLRTDGNLNIGTLAAGSTNSVITHSSNILQTRLVNSRVWDTAATFLSGSPNVNYLTKNTGLNTLGNSFIYEDSSNIYASRTIVVSSANSIGLSIRNSFYPLLELRDGDSNPTGNRWAMYLNENPTANKPLIIGPLNTLGSGGAALCITRTSSATNEVGNIGIKTIAPEATLHVNGNVKIGTFGLNPSNINSVVVNRSGFLDVRDINPRTWDTNATFLSGSPTTNKILKCTNSNTLGNTNMSDNGSTISVDSGQFSVPIGTNALPGFVFNSGNNNGFSYNTTNGIEASIGGSLKLRINTNYTHANRVLVNTTSYSTEAFKVNGTSSLEGTVTVTGAFSASDELVSTTKGIRVHAGQIRASQADSPSAPVYSFYSDADTGMYSPGANNLCFSTDGSERLRINGQGKVAINTDLMFTTLTVNRTIGVMSEYTSDSSYAETYVGELCANSTTAYGYARTIRYNKGTSGSSERLFIGNYVRRETDNALDSNRGGYINFQPFEDSGQATGDRAGYLNIFGPRKATGVGGTIRLYSGGYAVLTTMGDRSVSINTPDVSVNNSNTGWKTFSTGGVYHSTSSPYYIRHVSATSSTRQSIFIFRDKSATNRGSIQINTTNTVYNTTSDYRLKEDDKKIENSLERIMNLKPKNYKWKNSNTRSDGFYAHEVTDICPDAVTGEYNEVDKDNNPVYQQIDYSKLVPLLTASIQELKKEIDELKSKK